jgi:type I restriction enzyme S subunit
MKPIKKEYKYTHSGTPWIGYVPQHWKCTKLKRVLSGSLKYGANEAAELEDRNLPRYIRITDFGYDGKLKENTFKSLPIIKANQYPLEEGDILFARSGATVGKTFQFKNYKGKACYAGYLIKATPCKWIIESDFLYYFTQSIAYDEWKKLIFTQATIQNIGADKYQYLPIPVPPIAEQVLITKYLDHVTTKVNEALKAKNEQLRMLDDYQDSKFVQVLTQGVNSKVNLKDAEINWIGKMPIHWNRKRLKDVISLKSGDGITSTNIVKEGNFPVYGGNGLRGYTDTYTHEGYFPLIGRQGALCGNINYAEGKFFASEHAVVGKPILNCDVFWIGELMKIMNLNQYSNAAAQPGLSVDRIKQLYIPVPPKDEQVEISNVIKSIVDRVSSVKDNINSQIETLLKYRNSLIQECVTGKKQVCDAYIEE